MVFDVDEMLAGQLQCRLAGAWQVAGYVVLVQRVEHLPAVATGFHLGAVDAVHPRLGGMQGRVRRVVLEYEFDGAGDGKARGVTRARAAFEHAVIARRGPRIVIVRAIDEDDFVDTLSVRRGEFDADDCAAGFAEKIRLAYAEGIHDFQHVACVVRDGRLGGYVVGHAVARIINCYRPHLWRQDFHQFEIEGRRLLVHVQQDDRRAAARRAVMYIAGARFHEAAFDVHIAGSSPVGAGIADRENQISRLNIFARFALQ